MTNFCGEELILKYTEQFFWKSLELLFYNIHLCEKYSLPPAKVKPYFDFDSDFNFQRLGTLAFMSAKFQPPRFSVTMSTSKWQVMIIIIDLYIMIYSVNQ